MFFVYVLYSEAHDRLYIGQTNDLVNRLRRHNSGYEPFTKSYLPWKLLISFEYDSREEAVKMEKYWKQSNNRRKLRQMLEPKG